MSGFYSDKNSSRVSQPPGGSSSGIFGGPAGDAQGTPPQRSSARSASNIFGPAETDSPSRKVNTRMQSDIFGTTGSAPVSLQQSRANRMMSSNIFGEEAAQEPARKGKDRFSSDIFKEPSPSDQVMPRKLKGKEEDLYADPQAYPATTGDVSKYDGGKAEPDHDLDRAAGRESWYHAAEAQAGSGDAYHDTNPSHYEYDTAVIHNAPAPTSTTGGENIFDVRYGYTPQKPGRRLAQGSQPDMAATFLNLFGTVHPDPPPTGQPPAPTSMPAEALGYKPAPVQPTVPGHQRAAAGVGSGARDPRGSSAIFPEDQTASSNWRPSAKYRLRYQAALVNPITGETYASPDFDPPPTTNGTANGYGEDENPMDGETSAERPSTKVMQPPGGGSQITLG